MSRRISVLYRHDVLVENVLVEFGKMVKFGYMVQFITKLGYIVEFSNRATRLYNVRSIDGVIAYGYYVISERRGGGLNYAL